MSLLTVPVRVRYLALWLSLLALAAALLAPASVLAQEMRTGIWTGLCSAAPATEDAAQSHASGEGGHCGLCVLPGPALPPARLASVAPPAGTQLAPAPALVGLAAQASERPRIRAPPALG